MLVDKFDIVLYYGTDCFYCKTVMRYIDDNQITIPIKNIEEEPIALKELVAKTGRYTIPCLFIDGQPIYESNDIVAWFESNTQKSG